MRNGLVGMTPTAAIHLADDELAYVMDNLGVDDLPGVLDWRPRYVDRSERDAAFERAVPGLQLRGVVGQDSDVEPVVADMIRSLARSRWDLEVRTVTRGPDGPAVGRRCLSAGVDVRVVADRTPTGYELRVDDGKSVVTSSAPLKFSGVSAPRDTLVAALGRPTESTWDTLGCDGATAAVLARALSMSTCHVEIVMIGHRTAVPERVGLPIALLETPLGRVLATTSFAADGTAWSSLAPGTSARVEAEIRALIDLA